jgi:peptidoglycan/LPS O-acetylase OafA/YrhL
MSQAPSRTVSASNNFDLIRLLAALQVMLKHALVHLGFDGPWAEALSVFPGVPIFFFISGYLIFQSHSNSRSLGQFAINRLLRIYPALIVCFAVALGLVLATDYLALRDLRSLEVLAWTAAQLSVLQIYNADFLRGFGVGALNGSLWTVAVELQFYLLTPLLAWATLRRAWAWALIIGLGVLANLLLDVWEQGFAAKLFSVSFPPWFYMFALGAWLSTRADWQQRLLRLNPWLLLAAYAVFGAIGGLLGLDVTGNELNPLSYLLLAMLVFRLAHCQPELSDRLLRRNDISYGVYIYHMPVLNLLVFYGISGTLYSVAVASLATIAFALASWHLVERPALRLKKRTLRTQ